MVSVTYVTQVWKYHIENSIKDWLLVMFIQNMNKLSLYVLIWVILTSFVQNGLMFYNSTVTYVTLHNNLVENQNYKTIKGKIYKKSL